jgi:hypothetical protein
MPAPALWAAGGEAVGDEAAGGILAIWHDIEPAAEPEVVRWYEREHHAERVAVPGFLGARRYVALEGAPRWFIRYATTAPKVLASQPYLARLDDPTPWSQRCFPHFRNMTRTVCRALARHGAAEGGIVLTLRLSGGGQALRLEPLAGLVADLAAAPGIIATEVWQAERAPSALPSRETALRGAPDREIDLVAVLHAGDPLPLRALADRLAAATAGAAESAIGLYRLAYALGR